MKVQHGGSLQEAQKEGAGGKDIERELAWQ